MKASRATVWLRLHWPVGTDLLVDAGLALLVAVGNTVAISVASEPGSRAPDAIAYALGVAIGALLLGRRRWPLAILMASVAILFVYYAMNYPGIPPAIPLAVGLYTAVAAGHLKWGLPVSTFFICAGLVVSARKYESLMPSVIEMAQQAALLAVVLLLGEAVRNRRRYVSEVKERLRLADVDREREAARRVTEERVRIARELHDVMGHTISAIAVQAGLAADTLDDSPEEARRALGAIRAASREAMAEIRATVQVLRSSNDGGAPLAPAPRLDRVDELVAVAQSAGLRVEVERLGEPRPLPAAVDATAYRIVQESLTNVVRHARATRAIVKIRYESAGLGIEVADDGAGPAGGAHAGLRDQPGYGIVGMEERASALGGWLKAAPMPGEGFLVQAWLPVEGW